MWRVIGTLLLAGLRAWEPHAHQVRGHPRKAKAANALNMARAAAEAQKEGENSLEEPGNIFPFVDIPRSGGKSFLACTKHVFTCTDKGRASWDRVYPHAQGKDVAGLLFKAAVSKGCVAKDALGFGGVHCSVSEIEDCLSEGLADSDGYAYAHDKSKHRFITVLRNPIHRVLSEYVHWQGSQYWPHELVAAGKRGLWEWVTSPYNLAHNRQVKQMTTPGAIAPVRNHSQDCASIRPRLYLAHWGHRYGKHFFNQSLEETINKDRFLVTSAIRAIFYAGIHEKLESSVESLTEIMAKRPDGMEEVDCKAKTTKERKGFRGVINNTIIQEIARRNVLDIALYRNYANQNHLGDEPFTKMLTRNVTWDDVFQFDYE